jgi:hypothetical protein
MVTKGQINHRASTRKIPERLSEMSHSAGETGENMLSSHTYYNHSYSLKANQQLAVQPPLKPTFYEEEYKKMVTRMDSEKVVSPKNWKTSDPFGELLQISVLADEGYNGGGGREVGFVNDLPPTALPPLKRITRVSIHRLLKWKQYQDDKHELFMRMMRQLEKNDREQFERMTLQRNQRKRMAHEEFMDNPRDEDLSTGSTHEQREGNFSMSNASEGSSMNCVPAAEFTGSSGQEEDFKMPGVSEKDIGNGGDFVMGTKVEDDLMASCTVLSSLEKKSMSISKQKVQKNTSKNSKLTPCRHFTKGWCRQGDTCSFLHSVVGSYPDSCKVFLGGLPHSLTPARLLWELEQQGYVVVNQPKIFPGFSPQVCLSSESEAKKLLQVGKIMIRGCIVDVRPYKASTKKERDRQLDINNRSIFLGGLPSSVTLQILKTEIEKLGMKVTNRPLMKAGFIPRVTLASVEQAQELIVKGTININGVAVSVRPYVSQNKTN